MHSYGCHSFAGEGGGGEGVGLSWIVNTTQPVYTKQLLEQLA